MNMYPKTTFSTVRLAESIGDSLNGLTYRTGDMQNTHLILYDDEKLAYKKFDIDMPYLILYEAFDFETDSSVYMEFSEDGQINASEPYSLQSLLTQDRRLHSHDYYELTFVLSGRMTMRIEDESFSFDAGEGCLCNKNIHHDEAPEETAELVVFSLKESYIRKVFGENYYYDGSGKPHILENVFDTFANEDRKNPFYDAKIFVDFRKNKKTQENFLGLVNEMIDVISRIQSGKSHLMKALFCQFVGMLEDKKLYDSSIHWARLSREEQIVADISNAYRDKSGIFTRAEIEYITGYNSDHVERIMKRNTGMTLLEYGRSIMLQKAAILLTETDRGIGEICEEFGYSNRWYFNRIFENKYGVTPSEYRRSGKRGRI